MNLSSMAYNIYPEHTQVVNRAMELLHKRLRRMPITFWGCGEHNEEIYLHAYRKTSKLQI